MFIGHYATGLAFHIRKPEGKLTFFILVLGTQFVDILWGLFTLLGFEGGISGGSVEHNYFDIPWSHSLLMMVVWSVLYGFGTNFYVKQKYPDLNNFALLAGLSVFSHWILDFIVHNDDMRVLPTDDMTVPSLYLWEYPVVTFFVELVIIVGSWEYYLRGLKKSEGSEFTRKKPLMMAGLLLFLHIVNFLPSFSDADGSEADATLGAVLMIAIVLIAAVMAWIHPDKPENAAS